MTKQERAWVLARPGRKRSKPGWMPWAIALAVMIVTGIPRSDVRVASGAIRPAQVGSPAPDFTLRLFSGKTVTLSSLKGTPILLSFWHSG